MYGTNSVVIAVVLFLLILLANEIAYHIARRTAAKADQSSMLALRMQIDRELAR